MNPVSPEDTSTLVSDQVAPSSCIIHSMLRGSLGFGVVSLAGFSVWAFGGNWFHAHMGEAGLYSTCALVFLVSSGLLLHPLVVGSGSLLTFYRLFIPAFLAYTITWCAAWFVLRFGLGEWLGSFLGTLVFTAATGWGFGSYRGFAKVTILLFGFHSAGYFLGGQLMHWLTGPVGSALLEGTTKREFSIITKLSWGLLYGLGFGAGIGYAFHTFQHAGNRLPPLTMSKGAPV